MGVKGRDFVLLGGDSAFFRSIVVMDTVSVQGCGLLASVLSCDRLSAHDHTDGECCMLKDILARFPAAWTSFNIVGRREGVRFAFAGSRCDHYLHLLALQRFARCVFVAGSGGTRHGSSCEKCSQYRPSP